MVMVFQGESTLHRPPKKQARARGKASVSRIAAPHPGQVLSPRDCPGRRLRVYEVEKESIWVVALFGRTVEAVFWGKSACQKSEGVHIQVRQQNERRTISWVHTPLSDPAQCHFWTPLQLFCSPFHCTDSCESPMCLLPRGIKDDHVCKRMLRLTNFMRSTI